MLSSKILYISASNDIRSKSLQFCDKCSNYSEGLGQQLTVL